MVSANVALAACGVLVFLITLICLIMYRNLQAAERSASRATAKTRVNSQQYREWTPAQLMQKEPRQWHRPAWTPAELLQECERSGIAPHERKQNHRRECGSTAYARIGPCGVVQ